MSSLSRRTAHKLHVANPSERTATFRVDTDLEFVSGPPTITMMDGDVEEYPFMVEPLERGSFVGAIVVTTQSLSTAKLMYSRQLFLLKHYIQSYWDCYTNILLLLDLMPAELLSTCGTSWR